MPRELIAVSEVNPMKWECRHDYATRQIVEFDV